jgi:hypothetical protein
MSDLNTARDRLCEENLTLAIVKDGEVLFETSYSRISGFVGAIERLGPKLEGAAIADRVVGKAVALLCVYAKIFKVYADVLSKKAKIVLEENGIYHEWKELVDTILDLDRSDMCPFERAAANLSDPKTAYMTFKNLLKSKLCN